MMTRNANIMRREAERTANMRATVRLGIVSAYDPANYAAKVRLQPEDTETGWMPIGSGMGGSGCGDFYGPVPGDIVYVHFQESGKGAPFIGGFHFGDDRRPLPVPSGERWIAHKSGSFLKFLNDGTIAIKASAVNLEGDLNVTGDILATGDITDLDGVSGTVAHIRAVYNTHTHNDPQGGTVAAPNQPL